MISKFLKINLFFVWLLLGFILLPLSVLHAENQDIDKQYIIDQLMLGNDDVIKIILDTDDSDLKWLEVMVYFDWFSPYFDSKKSKELFQELSEAGDADADYMLFEYFGEYGDNIFSDEENFTNNLYFEYDEQGSLEASYQFSKLCIFFLITGMAPEECERLKILLDKPYPSIQWHRDAGDDRFQDFIDIVKNYNFLENRLDQNSSSENIEDWINTIKKAADYYGEPMAYYNLCNIKLTNMIANVHIPIKFCYITYFMHNLNGSYMQVQKKYKLAYIQGYVDIENELDKLEQDGLLFFEEESNASQDNAGRQLSIVWNYLVHESTQMGSQYCNKTYGISHNKIYVICLASSTEHHQFCLPNAKLLSILTAYGHPKFEQSHRYKRCRANLMEKAQKFKFYVR